MSEPYIEILKKVSSIVDNYPSEDQLFATTRKVVLVLDDTSQRIYKFLVNKYYPDKQFNNRLFVPNILEADNATFVFHDVSLHNTIEWEVANRIFMQKIIFNRPIPAKVLLSSTSLGMDNICGNCVGYHHCVSGTTLPFPCFSNVNDDFDLKTGDSFFKFLSEQLEFETSKLGIWNFKKSQILAILNIYNKFLMDLNKFADSVCNYLAPENTYKNTTITMQNETYTRLQMTHQFRYDKSNAFFLLPNNFEEVFQTMNVSIASIRKNWIDIREKQQQLRNWMYINIHRQQLDEQIKEIRKTIKGSIIINFDDMQMMQKINDQISEYLSTNILATFKHTIDRKFKQITDELVSAVITKHTEFFFKPMQELYTWFETNVSSLEQQNKIPGFFAYLEDQLDRYFGEMNSGFINFWLIDYSSRVPHDWQARLVGFNLDHINLVTGYYQQDLETYLSKISDISEFFTVVDYTVRESFENMDLGFELRLSNFEYFFKVQSLYSIRKGSMDNLSQFFEDWREIYPTFSKNNIKIVTLLENEYQTKFMNVIPTTMNFPIYGIV
jgi:hypothetical protein